MKDTIAFILLSAMLLIAIYTQINGVDYTQGQLLLHYWKQYAVAFSCGSVSLWLMIK